MKWETVRQFCRRERLWIDYNPTLGAYQDREPRDTCVKISSTYLDNKDRETGEWMLSDEQIPIR